MYCLWIDLEICGDCEFEASTCASLTLSWPLNFPPFCAKAEAWLVSVLVRVFIDTDDHKESHNWHLCKELTQRLFQTLPLPLKLCHLQRLNCCVIFHLSMNLWGKIRGAFVDVGWNVVQRSEAGLWLPTCFSAACSVSTWIDSTAAETVHAGRIHLRKLQPHSSPFHLGG